jgi:D-beta-D-heptose 7-phosphate kinase/D-beta-D-heptose 1-phosphate adenosyltransferase
MIRTEKKRVQQLFAAISRRSVMVVGDVMLDRYLWGTVSRMSPEAPVPVVEIESESCRFGGAANVLHNVASLGARAVPVGVIGDDHSGMTLKQLYHEKGFSTEGLIVDPERPTTVKTRVIAHNQHVVRTDREIRNGIPKKLQRRVADFVESHLDAVDAVILEDYNKGLLVPHLIEAIIDSAKRKGKKVLVDPKFDHFFCYKHVTLFKPNRKETGDILGIRLDSAEMLEKAGQKLLERLECRAVLITLGEEGMMLMESGRPVYRIPTQAQHVHDVSGAGDTVIAVMAVALSAGADLKEAAFMANHAAGIVCGEVGVVPVDRVRLMDALLKETEAP